MLIVLHNDYPNLHSHQQCERVLSSTSLLAFVIFCLFYNTLSNWNWMIPHCGFNRCLVFLTHRLMVTYFAATDHTWPVEWMQKRKKRKPPKVKWKKTSILNLRWTVSGQTQCAGTENTGKLKRLCRLSSICHPGGPDTFLIWTNHMYFSNINKLKFPAQPSYTWQWDHLYSIAVSAQWTQTSQIIWQVLFVTDLFSARKHRDILPWPVPQANLSSQNSPVAQTVGQSVRSVPTLPFQFCSSLHSPRCMTRWHVPRWIPL